MKTTFSRRELYALGEPIGDSATIKKVGGGRIYGMGGGGSTTSTGTTYTSNIPEYAKPYVETMLGATQKQLFTGNDTEDGGYNITGFKPYQPYSTNASDYIAPFSPLQQKAQQTVGGMQVPGQFQTASDVTGAGIMGAAGVGQRANSLYGMGNVAANAGNQYAQQATDPYSMSAYMSPYMQNVLQGQMSEAIRQSEMQGIGNKAQAVQAGAYGGSRQALVEAERQRNLGTQLGGIQAQGLQNAFQNAQQAQQFGSTLGLQGLQAGAGMYGQGVGAQQAAINQMMQGAGQYAGLGAQQLQTEQGIANLQNTVGAQQQSMEQQKINQSIQDYANAQQYPLMQLGVMSNMLRGLPMQATTTNQYVAAPNAITQGIGTAGAAASIYNATKAEGGVIKSMAQGGITTVPSYDVGGEVESQLERMGPEELEKQARESSSPSVRRMAARLLREKQMAQTPQGAGPVGPMGVDYQAPQLAGGGIIAFAKPDKRNNYSLVDTETLAPTDESYDLMPKRNAKVAPSFDENPAGGILGNASTSLAKRTPMTAERAIPVGDFSGENDPYLAQLKREHSKLEQQDARTVEEIAAAKEAAMGPNVAAQEMRAKVMGERANADDEAKRQRWMRAAQFFAKWGSTPGPVLVAGMNALNEKLPDIITDEQSYKKIKRDLDKGIYDLDQATRLEKMGYMKEASADKREIASRMAKSWSDITSFMSRARSDETTGRSALERTQMEVGAKDRATAAQLESTKVYRDQGNVTKAFQQVQLAESKAADVKGAIAREKGLKDGEYAKNAAVVERYERADEEKLTPEMKTQLAKARTALIKLDRDYNDRIVVAETVVQDLRDRAMELKDKKNPDAFDPKTLTGDDKAAWEWASNPTSKGWSRVKAEEIKRDLRGR
jgi:hypothetical protein